MKPIVKGYARGYARVEVENEIALIMPDEVLSIEAESNLLTQGIAHVKSRLHDLVADARNRADTVTESILEVHIMLMEDEALTDAIFEKVSCGASANEATADIFDVWIKTFSEMDNAYMNERCSDLRDLKTSLLMQLVKERSGENLGSGENQNNHDFILFTEELTPSQLASMDTDKLKGIVTKTGGETSHAAIMSKSLGIPMIVTEFDRNLQPGALVLMDAVVGKLSVNPTELESRAFDDSSLLYEKFAQKLTAVKDDACLKQIHVNLGDLGDLKKAAEANASGVGLFRTEFLFMKSSEMPSEDDQFEAYKNVLGAFGNRPVSIRTVDIGGDKELPYLALPREENPFLGYRAIRMCLNTHMDIFKAQLRAILRASVFGNARIMFPMIATLEEIRHAKAVLKDIMTSLDEENIPYDRNINVGIMIEVPSAAMQAEVFAKEVDFFSIGTNDLTQYTMAADRMNQNVAYLYSYFEPAVLMLVERTIQAALTEGIDVSVCGEMASNPMAIPILQEMGLKKFSVSPSRANTARYILEKLNEERHNGNAAALINGIKTRTEILSAVRYYMKEKFKEEMNWL